MYALRMKKQESPANAKVGVRQRCVHEGP